MALVVSFLLSNINYEYKPVAADEDMPDAKSIRLEKSNPII